MDEFVFKHGSLVIPDEAAAACVGLPQDELRDTAHGPHDQIIIFAARREISNRIITGIVAKMLAEIKTEPVINDVDEV